MGAVVLRGPSHAPPDEIVGPFASMEQAAEWAEFNPRLNGYCVAYPLTAPPDKDHVVRTFIQDHWKR